MLHICRPHERRRAFYALLPYDVKSEIQKRLWKLQLVYRQFENRQRASNRTEAKMRVVTTYILLNSLLLVSTALAARLSINIPPTQQLPNPYVLPSTTHATLQSHGAPLSAQLTRANKFTFDDVAPGSYLFTVHCRDYSFEPLRIDVESNQTAGGGEYVTAWQTFKGNEWDNKGELRGQGDAKDEVQIEVRSTGVKDYYQQRQGCMLHALRTTY